MMGRVGCGRVAGSASLRQIAEELAWFRATPRLGFPKRADVIAIGGGVVTRDTRPAEFETNLRRERQLEGIAAAKARGVYKGRPATINADAIHRLREEGLGATAIAKRLGIGRASVYRLMS